MTTPKAPFVHIGFRVHPQIKARLQEIADAERRTVANLASVILIEYLEKVDSGEKSTASNGISHRSASERTNSRGLEYRPPK